MTADNDYPKASKLTHLAGILSFIGGLFLLMSFASPYWIESYPEMFSQFKNMGMWEYCFDQFRYPLNQFDKLFSGCYYIFSQEFYVIREFLLPGWLMAVQAMVTLGFMGSITVQILLGLVVIRWPLHVVLRYEWMFVGISFTTSTATSFFLFLAVAVFGGNCYRRDWLQYPSFNVLSWSYAFAVIAMIAYGLAAVLLYFDSIKLYEMRGSAKDIVMQMQESRPPSVGFHPHLGSTRSGYM